MRPAFAFFGWCAAIQLVFCCGRQVKQPITTLRTFGKLLLGRLPREDTLNRELAKNIILQV